MALTESILALAVSRDTETVLSSCRSLMYTAASYAVEKASEKLCRVLKTTGLSFYVILLRIAKFVMTGNAVVHSVHFCWMS